MSSWTDKHILNFGNKNISSQGNFMGADAPAMFSLKMLAGTSDGLKERSSVLLSRSVATAIFGYTDPINKVIKLDNKDNFKVAGVYAQALADFLGEGQKPVPTVINKQVVNQRHTANAAVTIQKLDLLDARRREAEAQLKPEPTPGN